MKSILVLIAVLIAFVSFGQDAEFNDVLIRDTLVVQSGASFGGIVKGVDGVDPEDLATVNQLAASIGADSIYFNELTGEIILYNGVTPLDTTQSLDTRYAVGNLGDYIAVADTGASGSYYSQDQIDALISGASQVVFHISMPLGSGTVQGRIDVTTDLPPGWILTADGINLIVTHGLDRRVFGVTVWGKTGGTVEQELYDTNRYTLIESTDSNTAKIYGLSLFPGEIVVRIAFE